MDLPYIIVISISLVLLALIIILLLPIPRKLKVGILSKLSKLLIPIIIIIVLLLIGTYKEWKTQQIINQRQMVATLKASRERFSNNSLDNNAHKRNMYLYMLSVFLGIVLVTLIRLLNRFMCENTIIHEQMRVRDSVIISTKTD